MPTPPELMAPMLKKRLYAVICTLKAGKDIGPVLADHLEYLIGLEAEGKLFAYGPFTGDYGRPNGDGLILLRAASRAEAESLAAGAPFIQSGAQILRRPQLDTYGRPDRHRREPFTRHIHLCLMNGHGKLGGDRRNARPERAYPRPYAVHGP